jgi:hypothetical protein
MTTIFQDNLNTSPDNINWRGAVAAPFRTKKAALAAMATVATTDRKDLFKVTKRGSRWFLIVGQKNDAQADLLEGTGRAVTAILM